MRVLTVVEGYSLAGNPSGGESTPVNLNAENAPFLPNYDVVAVAQFSSDAVGAEIALEGRNGTNDTFTVLATFSADGGIGVLRGVQLTEEIRVSTTAAASSPVGTANVYLLGN